MNFSIIGAHGTGKTSTINEIRKHRSEWNYYSEFTRRVIPILGEKSAFSFAEKYGISTYELMAISQWHFLKLANDPLFNLSSHITILDRSPIDNLAYYYLLRKKDFEADMEGLLKRLAFHFASEIDYFIMFPSGIFPFEPDSMQVLEWQKEFQIILQQLLAEFGKQPYIVESVDLISRKNEIIAFIEEKIHSSPEIV